MLRIKKLKQRREEFIIFYLLQVPSNTKKTLILFSEPKMKLPDYMTQEIVVSVNVVVHCRSHGGEDIDNSRFRLCFCYRRVLEE